MYFFLWTLAHFYSFILWKLKLQKLLVALQLYKSDLVHNQRRDGNVTSLALPADLFHSWFCSFFQLYPRLWVRIYGNPPWSWSCPADPQSNGHSWGKLWLCTEPCETASLCLSALQTPCWPTTAAPAPQRSEQQQLIQVYSCMCFD